jgi:hypothetical protein
MANYYSWFINGHAQIASPLHKLTPKSSRDFNWCKSCQVSFERLKKLLTSPPILAYPRFDLPFMVAADASAAGIGGVLSQIQEDKEIVVPYWSRQLNKSEKNYSTIGSCICHQRVLPIYMDFDLLS